MFHIVHSRKVLSSFRGNRARKMVDGIDQRGQIGRPEKKVTQARRDSLYLDHGLTKSR